MAIAQREIFGRRQERPCALREPDLSEFSGQEIATIDRVIEALWGKSARDVTDLSHEFIGWQAAQPGEVIPYETVFVNDSEPMDEDVQHAQSLIAAGR